MSSEEFFTPDYNLMQTLLKKLEKDDKIVLSSLQSKLTNCTSEFNDLVKKAKASKIVSSLSTAAGVVSSSLLVPAVQQYVNTNGMDLSTPLGKTLLATTAVASFSAGGIGAYLANKFNSQSQNVAMQQNDLLARIEKKEGEIEDNISLQNRNEMILSQQPQPLYTEKQQTYGGIYFEGEEDTELPREPLEIKQTSEHEFAPDQPTMFQDDVMVDSATISQESQELDIIGHYTKLNSNQTLQTDLGTATSTEDFCQ